MKEQAGTDRLLRRHLQALENQAPASSCLDAETIAAWSDGSLQSHLRDAAAAHAADCARCLSVLAAVADTTPVPPRVSWAGLLPLRWLVPLTAAATAVFLWVLVERPPDPAGLSRPVPHEQTARSSTPLSERPQSAPSQSSGGRTAVQAPGEGIPRDRPATDASRPAPPASPPPPVTAPGATAPAGASPGSDRLERAPAVPERNDMAETVIVAPPVTDTASPEAAAERFTALSALVPDQPLELVSPDPAFRWRITGIAIERSVDSGGTWLRQATGSFVPLLAGSAPSPTVCWVAGRSGTVLRSTDGETWTRVPFSEAVDLVAITASDAATAAVTTSDARTYRTKDGGQTWTVQETPAAPF